jgi:hypothetical protein
MAAFRKKMKKVVSDYVRPGSSSAFMGLSTLHQHYEGKYSQKQLAKVLSDIDAYTLKREAKPVKHFNPIFGKDAAYSIQSSRH